MKLDSINERVLINRPCVGGAPAQRLSVRLTGPPHVGRGDRRKRDELDRVDLDLTEANRVSAALPDAWALPQSDRDRDVSRQHVAAQLAAELHTREAIR